MRDLGLATAEPQCYSYEGSELLIETEFIGSRGGSTSHLRAKLKLWELDGFPLKVNKIARPAISAFQEDTYLDRSFGKVSY